MRMEPLSERELINALADVANNAPGKESLELLKQWRQENPAVRAQTHIENCNAPKTSWEFVEKDRSDAAC